MKKAICIILAAFFLIMVPVKGYAASVPFFGIGEEIILPFLLSLLGVQASESIDAYDDLVEYNTKIKGSLLEKVSGLAGMEAVQEWLFKVVNGVIETDSVIWQKIREIAIENYILNNGVSSVPEDNLLTFPSFNFETASDVTVYNGTRLMLSISGCKVATVYLAHTSGYGRMVALGASDVQFTGSQSWTYDNKTVWFNKQATTTSISNPSSAPQFNLGESNNNLVNIDNRPQYAAWLMIYGGYLSASENIAYYSDAFDNVLTSQEKEDIIDGTSVVQLYNPAALQNGLEIIPGGDPEEDPNLKKIPFAVTADWWNFLQQFGSGASSNQYVNAYNALNGLNNTSVGRISDAYDSLGIASIAGAAADAAQGIISLTDNNIYPNSLTAADAINNTIPGNLTPETPDSGITNESDQGLYKLPDLRDYFPFCIPFDLIDLLRCFVAEPETPSFVLALSTGEEMSQQEFDLHIWDNIASMVRTFELVGFVLALILVTRNLIRG